MIKKYKYRIIGKDGRNHFFEINGDVACEYDQTWVVVNRDAIDKLLAEGATCPISIRQVIIAQNEL